MFEMAYRDPALVPEPDEQSWYENAKIQLRAAELP